MLPHGGAPWYPIATRGKPSGRRGLEAAVVGTRSGSSTRAGEQRRGAKALGICAVSRNDQVASGDDDQVIVSGDMW